MDYTNKENLLKNNKYNYIEKLNECLNNKNVLEIIEGSKKVISENEIFEEYKNEYLKMIFFI